MIRSLAHIVTLAVILAWSYPGQATILFDGRFESGTIKPLTNGKVDSFFYGAMSQGCTWQDSVPNNNNYSTSNDNKLITSPVRAGRYANSQTTRRNCDYRSYNEGGFQKPRQELGVTAGSFKAVNGTEYWFGWSMQIPNNYVNEENPMAVTSLMQLKQFENGSCCAFDVAMHENTIRFAIDNLFRADGTTLDTDNFYEWPLAKGVWHDVQVNFKMCTSGQKASGCSPFVHLYVNTAGSKNATPVRSWTGNANTNASTGFDGPKLNVYKYGYNCTKEGPNYTGPYEDAHSDFEFCKTNPNPTKNLESVTVLFDELLVGDASSSLAEIAPHVFAGVPPTTPAPPQDHPCRTGGPCNLIFLGDYEDSTITTPGTVGSGTPIINTFFYSGMGPNCEPRGNDPQPENGSRIAGAGSPVLSGKQSFKLEVRYDCDYRAFNEGGFQKPRTATSATHSNAEIINGKEYWLGLAFHLPAGFKHDFYNNPDNLFQLVKNEDGTTGDLGKNGINITLRDGKVVTEFEHPDGLDNPTPDEVEWPATIGTWHQVVLNFRMCKTSDAGCNGFIKLYVNGNSSPIYSDSGPNTISSTHGAHVNLYKYAWHCTGDTRLDYDACMLNPNETRDTGPRAIYFDNFNIGNQNSSLMEVMPSWGGNHSCRTWGVTPTPGT
jgi:hypothetical protein